jgi:hypothetical protein
MKANITAVYGPTEYHRESFAYGNPYQRGARSRDSRANSAYINRGEGGGEAFFYDIPWYMLFYNYSRVFI